MYHKETTPLTNPTACFKLSAPYQQSIRVLIYNACAAFAVGIFSGLVTTEIRATIPFSQLPPGTNLEATFYLMLVHGHIFAMHLLVPMAMAGMLALARAAGGTEIASKFLPKFTVLYVVGAWLSVALLLVRGLQVAYMAKHDQTDFDAIVETIVYNAPLRFTAYIFAHLSLTLGILSFVYHVLRSLRRPAENARPETVGM